MAQLAQNAGDEKWARHVGPSIDDMAVFVAWQNFNRPYAIRDGHPEPYFGLLCADTDFSVFRRSIPASAAVVYLYFLYDHPPGPVRTAHQWLAIKISRSARTVEVLDPTSELCGYVTPIEQISAALRQSTLDEGRFDAVCFTIVVLYLLPSQR